MHRPARETQGLEAFSAQNSVSNSVVLLLLERIVMGTIHLDG